MPKIIKIGQCFTYSYSKNNTGTVLFFRHGVYIFYVTTILW